jgi:hypothetical protein
MTSSITLKKLVSLGAAMLLAVGGSLVAAEPAHAGVITATPVLETGVAGAHIQAGMTSLSFSVPGCSMSGTPQLSEFALTNVGGTQTIQSVAKFGYLVVTLSSALVGGEQLTITYTPGTLSCGGGNTLGAFTFTDSVPAIPAVTGTPTLSASGTTLTAVPASSAGSIYQYWYLCTSSKTASNSTFTPPAISGVSGCSMLFNSADTTSPANTTTLSLTGTYYVRAGSSGSYTYPAANFTGGHVIFAQAANNGSVIARSASVAASGDSGAGTTAPTVIPESAKPLPVWAAPILKAIPTLSKTLTTEGGKVSLTDGDFSSLKSVTVGGQAVVYSIDAKGDVNIPIPAGKAGTTADLIVTFTGGKMTIQDGIKYVAPLDIATVREAPIAGFKGKSTKITGDLAAAIQYAAQLDKKATTVLCTGYAASKAAVATVTAQAEAACAYATKANDQLLNKSVKVVVNAKLAKTATVGIKVHK